MKHTKSSVVLVFNDKNELAVQLRAAGDAKYPAHWDFSAAGGIEAGESPLQAAERELREEIGIAGELQFVDEYLYNDENGEDILSIFALKHNGPFAPDPNEVDDVQFFTFEKIDDMIRTGGKFHPEFIALWNRNILREVHP